MAPKCSSRQTLLLYPNNKVEIWKKDKMWMGLNTSFIQCKNKALNDVTGVQRPLISNVKCLNNSVKYMNFLWHTQIKSCCSLIVVNSKLNFCIYSAKKFLHTLGYQRNIWGVPPRSRIWLEEVSLFFGDFRHLSWAYFLCKWAKILIFDQNFCQLALLGKWQKIWTAINLAKDHKWSIPMASLLTTILKFQPSCMW